MGKNAELDFIQAIAMTSWQRTQINPLPDQLFAHQPYLLLSPSRLNQGLSIPWFTRSRQCRRRWD
jgi:hypothetical protein